jgi:hypothetical protein
MEVWKDIEGYEGYYQVSNFGNVKSLNRSIPNSRCGTVRVKERILKPRKNHKGYFCVLLMKNSIPSNRLIHRLVCMSFLPNEENKEQVNHKNGVKTDNRLENLEWSTQSENIRHAFDNGLKFSLGVVGEKNYNSKLSEQDVRDIRISNLSQKILSEKYKVHQSIISEVKARKRWKHVI